MTADDVKKELKKLQNPKQAKLLARFFRTAKGEYGEGDKFLGVMVPQQRQVAGGFPDLSLDELEKLLGSPIHEHRFTALVILMEQYKKAMVKEKGEIVRFYLSNTKNINNWDLVDVSAPKIIGDYLLGKDRSVLYKLARSKNLWEKRIAILTTAAFIKEGQFKETLEIAKILIKDSHDLIHKAVGWMLREVGKRDQRAEEKFLKKHYKKMPRVMLRYAIEKFSRSKRDFYLEKKY